MKKSELIKIVREELQSVLKEYGSESLYFSPGGFEQVAPGKYESVLQRYDSYEKWKINAMQLGAVITDRGDDFIAMTSDNTKLGTFNKMLGFGTLRM